MWRIRRFALRLWNALRRERAEPDLSREIDSHLALLADDFRRRGLTPEDARLAARRAFGGIEQAKDLQRDARSFVWLDDARRDLRYAIQLLRRSPVFAFTATLSLAIGIGATTTIFTVANGLLLRAPEGVAAPDRLVDIFHVEKGRSRVAAGMAGPMVPYSLYLDTRERTTTLESVYAYDIELLPTSLRISGGAERVFTSLVSPNYFTALGVAAASGRLFGTIESEYEGANPVVVLSHRFWTRRFRADPSIVGQTFRLNGQPFTVIGVAAEAFQGTNVLAADMWVPAPMTLSLKPGSALAWMQVVMGGRLKPGVSIAQAASELDLLGTIVYEQQPRLNPVGGTGAETVPGLAVVGASPLPGPFRLLIAGFLALLMSLVCVVLVIACANLAGVQLARASARRREIAVRLAIGAGRGRLIRQLLTETLLLFALGGAAGLMLARVMTAMLVALLPAFPVPVGLSLPLDIRVVVFAIALTATAALLSGLAPALHASKADVVTIMKDEVQGSSERLRLRHAFVVVQVAFSLLLVVLAGLLGRALAHVTLVDRGFDSRGIELATVDLTQAGYTDASGPAFARMLLERVRQLPMVESATMADRAPRANLMRVLAGDELTVPGVTPPRGRPFFNASWTIVEPGYFDTLRIPLLAGRDFNAADRPGADAVIIVPEATARRLWPGQNAVGKYIVMQSRRFGPLSAAPAQTKRLTVIGVAKDLTNGAPRESSALELYTPLQQRYTPEITIIARTAIGRRIASDIRALVESTDPNLPVLTARTLDEDITGPVEVQLRIAASVSGSVGIVSLLLATIGIYGITAYVASRRTREIGIRLALGAKRSDVLRMILRQGMILVSIGLLIGLVLAAAGGRLLKTLLFGVPPLDPWTFGGATVCFALIGLAACYMPAWRATRVDSVEALRYE